MRCNPSSIYIHIPFCKNICTYCDFKKMFYDQKLVDKYFKSLFLQFNNLPERKYKSIYIGGGTPSSINKDNLEALLKLCSQSLNDKFYEFSIECNVEDINEDFLKLIFKYKVNRLSIGVQTFNDKFIKFCNRHHTKQMAIDNINLASKYIKNISVDMIYAYPNQTLNELKQDLKTLMSLPIKHLSYYSLLIEPNTILWLKKYDNVDDDTQAKMYKVIYNYLNKFGFSRYEISSFAKNKKYQSYHNKVYWQNKHYAAIGLNASGYENNVRYTYTCNFSKYINNDFSYSNYITLSKDDKMFDEIMLNLRLDDGLNIKKFNKKYHVDFLKKYAEAINITKNNKLIVIKDGKIKTTFKGSLLLNSILQYFLD